MILSVLVLSLTACAGMSGNFACNAKGTDSCMPISAVDHGDYRVQDTKQHSVSINPNARGYRASTPMPGEPIRRSEDIQRVWIAPYEDHLGNYHEPSFVYFVLKKSSWIGVGTKEIQLEEGDH